MVWVTITAEANDSSKANANGRTTSEFLVPVLNIKVLPAPISSLNISDKSRYKWRYD